MAMVAHDPKAAKRLKIPQSVGKEFVSADKGKKFKKGGARQRSFCARMSGMPGPMKDEKGRPTRKAASLKRWNCK